jgi:Calcineurin-like phosphoesterase
MVNRVRKTNIIMGKLTPRRLTFQSSVCLAFLIIGLCQFAFSESSPELRFAVCGDVHYQIPDYTVADCFVEPMAKELTALNLRPSFLLHTGDFFHASKNTDWDAEAAYAFKHFSSTIKIPFYNAIGNHDKRSIYEKNALPIFSKQLERNLTTSYYSFDKSNCHFLILDCMQRDFTGQLSWAEEDIKAAVANPKIEHIFAAGHYPLWIVARSGFCNENYSKAFAELLARYSVDAYFCGHTHNNSVTVRLVGDKPLTQIMGCAIAEDGRLFKLAPFLKHTRPAPDDPCRPGLLPLEESRRIFIPSDELEFYWGYQEGSTSSYNFVTVRGRKVTVDWRVLGSGIIRSYEWTQPGKLVNTKEPVYEQVEDVCDEDIYKIQRAWCYTAPWIKSEEVRAPLEINGIPAGVCMMTKKEVASSPFWNMLEIPLTQDAVAGLRKTNTLLIRNPDRKEFGIAHLFLLAQMEDGRIIKTNISPKVNASFPMKDQEWFFPVPELINPVNLGEDLSEITLKFEKVIMPTR